MRSHTSPGTVQHLSDQRKPVRVTLRFQPKMNEVLIGLIQQLARCNVPTETSRRWLQDRVKYEAYRKSLLRANGNACQQTLGHPNLVVRGKVRKLLLGHRCNALPHLQ